MFPIILPAYRIRPCVEINYAEFNGTYLERQTIRIDAEFDGTLADYDHVISTYVPAHCHENIISVFFDRDQPLNKVRYGQAELDENEVSQVLTMEYSITRLEVTPTRNIIKRSLRVNTTYPSYAHVNARLYLAK